MFFLFFISLFSPLSLSAELSERYGTTIVDEKASFEELRDDSSVPVQTIPVDANRGNLVDSLKWSQNQTLSAKGYPSGNTGINLGGRSTNDTQVFTLGIPLNLGQGGGADLSFFPSYLWKSARLSPTATSAGYTPEGAAGSMELVLWTRERVKEKSLEPASQFGISYDRQIQTFSIATRKDNIAMMAGMSAGLETGPAGSLSYYFLKNDHAQFMFHLLGSEQDGNSPGTSSNPSPLAKKKTWRVIPALESRIDLGDDYILESTFYTDIHELKFVDPSPLGTHSSTRTEQYGFENALVHHLDTFALSARYIRFDGRGSFPVLSEAPLFGAWTHDFALGLETSLKTTVNSVYVERTGFYPGGKLSFRFAPSEIIYPYLELNSLAKMPSLVDRYAVYGTYYTGNPNLKPERVNNAIAGYHYDQGKWKNDWSVKGEYRNQIIVSDGAKNSMKNFGNAWLIILNQNINYQLNPQIRLISMSSLNGSHLSESSSAYPNLPALMDTLGFSYKMGDQLELRSSGKLASVSNDSFGSSVPSYTLFDQSLDYQVNRDLTFTAGVDNIFNNKIELNAGYPLPGRIVYLGAQARF